MPKVDEIPGLNWVDEPYEVGLSGLVVANNIDHLRGKKAKRRPGRQQVYAGSPVAAAGDQGILLFTEGNALKQLNADYSATMLVSGLADQDKLWVCRTPLGQVYWSTQRDHGVIRNGINESWNIPRPAVPDVATTAFGLLRDARYLYSLAFLRDGIEGPLSHTAVWESEGGVEFTLLDDATTLASVDGVRLYLSTPHGTELYQVGDFAIGTQPVYLGDATEFGLPADLDDFIPMPVGGPIRYFAGRLWISYDSSLIYSEEYHSMPRPTNFIGFGEGVKDFGNVSDGLWVGTENHTYFLGGTAPREMLAEEKAGYGMIPGTLVTVDGRLLGEGVNELVPMWASPRGICAGLPGGTLLNLSERRVNNLSGLQGTSMFRQRGGQNHFVTVLQS